MTRDVKFAIGASVAVVAVLTLGFLQFGSPGKQRLLEADNRRVQDLRRISSVLYRQWHSSSNEHKLPSYLTELRDASPLQDPVTQSLYEYHSTGESSYQLCADFSLASSQQEQWQREVVSKWKHPAGHHCFSLNAATDVEPFF